MDEIKATIEALSKEANTTVKGGALPKSPGKGAEGADPVSFAAGVRYAVRKLKASVKKAA